MAKKAILIEDIETSFLDNIVLLEDRGISCIAEYKKLCTDYPDDYKEITLTDKEYNRISKHKQEESALYYVLENKWNIN